MRKLCWLLACGSVLLVLVADDYSFPVEAAKNVIQPFFDKYEELAHVVRDQRGKVAFILQFPERQL